MDADAEAAKLKFMLVVVAVFLISCYMSCQELKFATKGKLIEATVTDIKERQTRRSTVREVYYDYRREDNQIWHGHAGVSDDYSVPRGTKIQIEYTGEDTRLAGQRNWVGLSIFFISLLAMIVGGVMFWLHVRAAIKPSGGYKRR